MSREKKAQIIDRLQEAFSKCSIVILTDYRGLVTLDMTNLRRKLRESGSEYKVVKNTLARLAAMRAGKNDLVIVSREGKSIRFSEAQVKPTHRDTSGVRGIKLTNKDEVVSLSVVGDNQLLLVIMENGLGKKTLFSAWNRQSRGGQGVKAAQVTTKTGPIVTAQAIDGKMDTLVLTSTKGQLIKMNLAEVPTLQRQTQGVILMRVRPGEKVAAATVVASKEKTE